MERLTKKELCDYTTMDFHLMQMDWHSIYNKLAEFEDFMEANKFENINELQNAINGKFEGFFDEKHEIWIKTVEDSTKCKKENQTLKGNWAKLKEWVWDKEPLFKGANAIFKKSEVLEKMRELEGGDGRNKQ